MGVKKYELSDGRKAVFEFDENGIGKITIEFMDMLMEMAGAQENDMELISREDVKSMIKSKPLFTIDERVLMNAISSLPTIEERKEGRWIRTKGELICSICEYPAEFNPLSSDFIESNYCPNCGARMKGE